MLTILKQLVQREKYGSYRVLAQCHCGLIRAYRRSRVLAGVTTNCGCVNIKHGEHSSITYVSWEAMMGRCYTPKKTSYRWYGAKGIKVCDSWKDYRNFKSDMGQRPGIEYSIDRLDSKRDYSKDNCRWILKSENSRRAHAARRV